MGARVVLTVQCCRVPCCRPQRSLSLVDAAASRSLSCSPINGQRKAAVPASRQRFHAAMCFPPPAPSPLLMRCTPPAGRDRHNPPQRSPREAQSRSAPARPEWEARCLCWLDSNRDRWCVMLSGLNNKTNPPPHLPFSLSSTLFSFCHFLHCSHTRPHFHGNAEIWHRVGE